MNDESPLIIDGITGEIETLPPAKGQRYRCKLDTQSDVKREMAKVYREARSGITDNQDATKQIWMLQTISKIIETEPPKHLTPISLDEFYSKDVHTMTDEELMRVITG